MSRQVYTFGDGEAEGGAGMRDLLGGKGANLAEMARLGLPVPPGFTITTEVCRWYYANGRDFPEGLREEVEAAIARTEALTGRRFGDSRRPLLMSVRSGARASMPGMMDTVLNLGLNDRTVEALAADAEDRRFAFDSYRRFITMYGNVVLGLEHRLFEDRLEDIKNANGHHRDTDLTADDLAELVGMYKALVAHELGKAFPQDPHEQIWGAIGAVFSSWMTPRAVTYRKLNNIPGDWGTAVTVQAMVFGNMGPSSATGVAFTRNPSTGAKALYGEFLVDAQGEDVVAGIRTPQELTESARVASGSQAPSLEKLMPEVFAQFRSICDRLEQHYRDLQDVEFTIERGKLWMLQTRSGKRTAKAALKAAVDMTDEGLITREQALLRIDPMSLDQLLHPSIDPNAERPVFAKGLPASPGAASGEIVLSSHEAEAAKAAGRRVILVRVETSPEDIHGMHAAEGILTTRGGMTSHAAVVARGMGKPCVSGAGAIRVDMHKETVTAGGRTLTKGDIITIDGSTGEVLIGAVAMVQPELSSDFQRLMSWADEVRRMAIRTNADTPGDARAARSFGAEGIGLCRTEHMFFGEGKIGPMREMILADTLEGRKTALAKLLPLQRKDFEGIFEAMAGRPVTIRTIDPPLHEFLPHEEGPQKELGRQMGVSFEKVRQRVQALHEFNPMLGFRGCRLGVIYPEITEMQSRAIFEAAANVKQRGIEVGPEVMIPLVGNVKELTHQEKIVRTVAEQVMKEKGVKFKYLVGTMIEIPRGAITADKIADVAEFFSFGTNDLTQTTLGVSRDDAGTFLIPYVDKEIYAKDPFDAIDREGVGELMKMAVAKGRSARPNLKLGICGEHGGEPSSVEFCHQIGLNYVSCSPFRVPIARLAAARAALADDSTGKKKTARKRKGSKKR